jgi:hypothetical protein
MLEIVGKSTIPRGSDLEFSLQELSNIHIVLARKITDEIGGYNKIMAYFCDAWAQVEAQNQRVTDVVIGIESFALLKEHGVGSFDASCLKKELEIGLMGMLWDACVWVLKDENEINCFQDRSKEFPKTFPSIYESKILLNG